MRPTYKTLVKFIGKEVKSNENCNEQKKIKNKIKMH